MSSKNKGTYAARAYGTDPLVPGNFSNVWMIDRLEAGADPSGYAFFSSSIKELRQLLAMSAGHHAAEYRAYTVFSSANYANRRGNEGLVWVLPCRRVITGEELRAVLEAEIPFRGPLLFTPNESSNWRYRRRRRTLLELMMVPAPDGLSCGEYNRSHAEAETRYLELLRSGVAVTKGTPVTDWYQDMGLNAGYDRQIWLFTADPKRAARQIKSVELSKLPRGARRFTSYPTGTTFENLLEAIFAAAFSGKYRRLDNFLDSRHKQLGSHNSASLRDYEHAADKVLATVYDVRCLLAKPWYAYPVVRAALEEFRPYLSGIARATHKYMQENREEWLPARASKHEVARLYEVFLRVFGRDLKAAMAKCEKRYKEPYLNERAAARLHRKTAGGDGSNHQRASVAKNPAGG